MKELDKQILPKLIAIYSTYLLRGPEDEVMQTHARTMYNQYYHAWSFMSDDIAKAHSRLFGVAFPQHLKKTHTSVLSKEKTRKILETLKKFEAQLY